MREHHALFQKYPVDDKIVLGGETLPTPYHIYDGAILFIGGRANADAARELLRGERLTPLLDQAGNALMAAWVCDFTQANLDAHTELQISIFAAYADQPPVPAHPFAIYRQLTRGAYMVCHGLWNNTERVVRYNRDHLMLDARLARSHFDRTAARWQFRFTDADQLLVDGALDLPRRQPPADLWALSAHLGMSALLRSLREPFIHVPVVNTVGAQAAENWVAPTYTRADRQVIRRFTPADRLTIHAPRYAALQFQPDFAQYSGGVRFVYLRPEPLPGF